MLQRALEIDDISAIESALHDDPALLNPPNGRPPITLARSTETARTLLELGADPALAAKWWAPGFCTRSVDSKVARLLVDQGAALTPHAAAGLGLLDHLSAIIDIDPSVVHLKGGDGCTPLHFARNVDLAQLLLDRGAAIDARDDDHDSTPAQWLIGDVPEVTGFLLGRGATADIFMAASLGNRALAEKLIDENPQCTAHRIGLRPDFPPLGDGRGGTIYQWTLAFNSFPHQIALLKGHTDLFELLYRVSDDRTRLLVCCVLARRVEAEAIALANPGIVAALAPHDHELLARYCWETNTNIDAVRLMLDVGFPVAHPELSHGYTPLHNAAWSGSAELVDLLIARGHPVNIVDPRWNATPLGFALHDCLVEKRHPEGEFARVVRSLINAGAAWDPTILPTGNEEIDAVLRARRF